MNLERSDTYQIGKSNRHWLSMVIAAAALIGCNGDSPPPPSQLAFDPNSLERTLEWFAELDKRQESQRGNPLNLQEIREKNKQEIDLLSGKEVHWKIAISKVSQELLTGRYYLQLTRTFHRLTQFNSDAQVFITFGGDDFVAYVGPYPGDISPAFYRTLKEGGEVTVKGIVRLYESWDPFEGSGWEARLEYVRILEQ